MTNNNLAKPQNSKNISNFLKGSGSFWFITAALGQALFFYFIVKFYYTSTLSGNFEWWDKKILLLALLKMMPLAIIILPCMF